MGMLPIPRYEIRFRLNHKWFRYERMGDLVVSVIFVSCVLGSI